MKELRKNAVMLIFVFAVVVLLVVPTVKDAMASCWCIVKGTQNHCVFEGDDCSRCYCDRSPTEPPCTGTMTVE